MIKISNLSKYNKKRNFDTTTEPKGEKRQTSGKKLKFVMQHHLAKKDHYDLRLEYNGVYVSFAVPKGPSYNPKDKRLAVKVEDHPLSYGNFEGTIPKGEYGGGTVMLWDKGYLNYSKKPNFKTGPVKFKLFGKRLKGAWTLVNIEEKNWILIKENDNFANYDDIKKYETSIKTAKTMKEIENPVNCVEITNPDKIIFSKNNISKQDIVNYYKLISSRMMPFLQNRLISTVRAPQGVEHEYFYMKHLNTNSKNIGKKQINKSNYYYLKNEIGLIEEVQMNSYEFHIWGAKENALATPDILVFDLDPDEGLPLRKVRDGVRDLKIVLDELNLKSFLKTSGGKGYHIYVPIQTSWKNLMKIAENISLILVNKYPDKYTTNIRKSERKNKILIDYFRNNKGATSVCPYSLRLKENATISFPISWDDLNKVKPNSVTIKNAQKYLGKEDPWKDFFNY